MEVDPDLLVRIGDLADSRTIAEALGKSQRTVNAYPHLHPEDYPKPVAILGGAAIRLLPAVVEWYGLHPELHHDDDEPA